MKKLILTIAVTTLVLVSCNQKNKSETPVKTVTDSPESKTVIANSSAFSTKEIVTNYLAIKNALTKDDSNASATEGNALVETLGKIDMSKLSQEQMKTYMDIADDIKENAEHIGKKAGNIEHQREHFVALSKDVNDLIKTFGSEQKLYQDFCPMADGGKGAIWISEVKAIKNPYYGSKMITCGSLKSEL